MANRFFKDNVEIRLICGEDVFKGKGKNVLEALRAIKYKRAKAVGNFEVIENGKVSKINQHVNILKLQRMFTNDMELQIFAKRLEVLK